MALELESIERKTNVRKWKHFEDLVELVTFLPQTLRVRQIFPLTLG